MIIPGNTDLSSYKKSDANITSLTIPLERPVIIFATNDVNDQSSTTTSTGETREQNVPVKQKKNSLPYVTGRTLAVLFLAGCITSFLFKQYFYN
jgi:hypothetical protein